MCYTNQKQHLKTFLRLTNTALSRSFQLKIKTFSRKRIHFFGALEGFIHEKNAKKSRDTASLSNKFISELGTLQLLRQSGESLF